MEMSYDVGDVEEHSVGGSYLFVEGVGIERVELDSEEFDEIVETDTGCSWRKVCADMAIAQSKICEETSDRVEVGVVSVAAEEDVLESSAAGIVRVKRGEHTIHLHSGVRRSPGMDVCPARLVEGD